MNRDEIWKWGTGGKGRRKNENWEHGYKGKIEKENRGTREQENRRSREQGTKQRECFSSFKWLGECESLKMKKKVSLKRSLQEPIIRNQLNF